MTKVLVTTKMMQDANLFAEFRDRAEFVFLDPPQFLSEKECLDLVDGIDIWICGDDRITRQVTEKASKSLKLVIKWGAGFDSIDTEALSDFNIEFRHTPNVLSNAVAEYALGLTLSLLRHIHAADQAVRSGVWTKIQGQELSGKTIGIIGYGSIGRATGEKFAALGCEVIHVDPKSDSAVSLDELLQKSLIIVLCANLNEVTWGILSFEEFSRMRKEALVINVSRGELIVEAALVRALEHKLIWGAALDVYAQEPLPESTRLRSLENLLLAPHNASNTIEARNRANQKVIQTVREFFDQILS